MSEYEKLAIIVSFISGCISIAAVIFAFLRWKASHQSAQVASANMYISINDFVGTNAKLFGPLTPYGSEPDEGAIKLRLFLLMRLNRFKFASGSKERKEHVLFRKRTMGSSLREFRELLIKRGASDQDAEKIVRIFASIKKEEPNLNRKFWKTFFACFDWTIPNAP